MGSGSRVVEWLFQVDPQQEQVAAALPVWMASNVTAEHGSRDESAVVVVLGKELEVPAVLALVVALPEELVVLVEELALPDRCQERLPFRPGSCLELGG